MPVALFVTCLVDLWRPRVGQATLELLGHAGVTPVVPSAQTCCGQPGYNVGDFDAARALARRVTEEFARYDAVVVPSGSCAGMLRIHYPKLFEGMPELPAARALAARTYELSQFLVSRNVMQVPGRIDGAIAYHDSCSARRELGIYAEPRRLLALLPGAQIKDIPEGDTCCGFGGTFSVKYDAISTRLAERKCVNLNATGACALIAGDLGCLLHLEGRLRRRGDDATRVLHLAEALTYRGAPCK